MSCHAWGHPSPPWQLCRASLGEGWCPWGWQSPGPAPGEEWKGDGAGTRLGLAGPRCSWMLVGCGERWCLRACAGGRGAFGSREGSQVNVHLHGAPHSARGWWHLRKATYASLTARPAGAETGHTPELLRAVRDCSIDFFAQLFVREAFLYSPATRQCCRSRASALTSCPGLCCAGAELAAETPPKKLALGNVVVHASQ